jgi:hypothetical protein
MLAMTSACGAGSTSGRSAWNGRARRRLLLFGSVPPRATARFQRRNRSNRPRTFLDFQCTAPPPFVGGMCVVFLYIRTPKLPGEEAIDCPYAAVIAVNRDEGYTRDTARLHWWPQDAREDPRECRRDWQILAGRDGEGGGTWCGVSRDGRFAVLTNVAEATPQFKPGEAPSRGELPVAFLEVSGHLSKNKNISTHTHPSILAGETSASTPRAMATRPIADQGQIQRVQPHRRGLEDRRVRLPNQQERRRIKRYKCNRSTRLGLERRWDPMRLWIHPRPEQRRFEHPMAQGDTRDGPHAM